MKKSTTTPPFGHLMPGDLFAGQDRLVAASVPPVQEANLAFISAECEVKTPPFPFPTATISTEEDRQKAAHHLAQMSHFIVPGLDSFAGVRRHRHGATDSTFSQEAMNIFASTESTQRWLQKSLTRLDPGTAAWKTINLGELNEVRRMVETDLSNLPDLFGHLENTTVEISESMAMVFDLIREHEGAFFVPVDDKLVRSFAACGLHFSAPEGEINPLLLLLMLSRAVESSEQHFIEMAVALVASSAAVQRVRLFEQVAGFVNSQASRLIDVLTNDGAADLPEEFRWLEVAMADPVSAPWDVLGQAGS